MDKDKLRDSFERKGFKVFFFDDRKSLIDHVLKETEGYSVGIGGSKSVDELGLYDELVKSSGAVYWHWKSKDSDILEKARTADFYILSANGVSETGEIINIDGKGNRVAASIFGPDKVIYIIGENKVRESYSEAYDRARNIAAVRNAERFKLSTPCVRLGKCVDCNSPERICRTFVTIDRPRVNQQVELLFLSSSLGF